MATMPPFERRKPNSNLPPKSATSVMQEPVAMMRPCFPPDHVRQHGGATLKKAVQVALDGARPVLVGLRRTAGR